MISRDSIALAENIAVAMGDTVVQPTDILAGLNEESYGALPYTEHWRDQLVDVTGNITAHTVIKDAATTRLAEIIRGAFEMVKTYGVPLAGEIANAAAVLYTPERLSELATRSLRIQYANVDDPFFNSSIYPTSVRNTALSFTGVSFDVLKKLSFNWVTNETLKEYLNTSHPEILAIIDSTDSDLSWAMENMSNLDNLSRLFVCSEGGAFDFTQIKSININLLLKMYILISKMYASNSPVEWLSKGSLEDYREYVELMWNALTTYLIALKKIMEIYRSRKLVMVENTASSLASHMPNESLGVTVKVIEADITVYYTFEALKEVEGYGMALSDMVMASLYARMTGRTVGLTDLLGNKTLCQELIGAYTSTLHNAMEAKSYDYFMSATLKAIAKFITDRPAAQEALVRATGDENSSTLTIVRERLKSDIDKMYYLFSASQAKVTYEVSLAPSEDTYRNACIDTVLQTRLVPTFLRLLGCDLAAEIIEITFVTQAGEENLIGQRQRVHGALIEMLAGKLLA